MPRPPPGYCRAAYAVLVPRVLFGSYGFLPETNDGEVRCRGRYKQPSLAVFSDFIDVFTSYLWGAKQAVALVLQRL